MLGRPIRSKPYILSVNGEVQARQKRKKATEFTGCKLRRLFSFFTTPERVS